MNTNTSGFSATNLPLSPASVKELYPNSWLSELIRNGQVFCPKCRQALRSADQALICTSCEHSYPVVEDVADLFLKQASVDRPRIEPYVKALMSRYALPESEHTAVQRLVEESLTSPGSDGVAAEVDLFTDRFALFNSDLRLTVVRHYISEPLPANSLIHRSFRIRNDGDFPWVPSAENGLNLSYHLLRSDGSMALYNGERTILPVEIPTSREITVPVKIRTPAEPGRYILRLVLVREMVRWGDEGAVDVPITVARLAAPKTKSPKLPEFTGPADSEIAVQLIEEFVHRGWRTPDDEKSLDFMEIGGGNSPESLMIVRRCTARNPRVLNIDVSASLLRLGALHLRHNDPSGYRHVSFVAGDANHMPLADGIADAVLLCRTLHHFADPVHLLKVCHQKLKANGFLALMCEPVGSAYDAATSRLMAAGVNEQVFALEDYYTMFREAGFRVADLRCDWGFSLKAILLKNSN